MPIRHYLSLRTNVHIFSFILLLSYCFFAGHSIHHPLWISPLVLYPVYCLHREDSCILYGGSNAATISAALVCVCIIFGSNGYSFNGDNFKWCSMYTGNIKLLQVTRHKPESKRHSEEKIIMMRQATCVKERNRNGICSFLLSCTIFHLYFRWPLSRHHAACWSFL